MKKNIIILSITATVLTLSSSCRKYEDGPGVSLLTRKARVENNWYIEKYTVNGTDSTSQYSQWMAGEFYTRDGSYRTTYGQATSGLTPAEVSGRWEFQNNDREIRRTLTNGRIDILEVLRLKNNSFRYRMKRGNDVLEFHLTNDQRNVPR